MNADRRLALVLATAALAGGLASPTLAADQRTVDAVVTIDAPCLTVTTSNLDFGRHLLSPDGELPVAVLQDIGYASCSGTPERVFARGTDASGPSASWALVNQFQACPEWGTDRFGLRATSSRIGEQRTYDTWYLGTADVEIETLPGDATGAVRSIDLLLPCQGSNGSGQTMSFRLVFTATF